MTPHKLDTLLDSLQVSADYRALVERMVQCAGARRADVLQTFCLELLQAREEGRPEPESLGLAAARRWLRRERIHDALLTPVVLEDSEGKERERPLAPLPCPIPASRVQIQWGRRAEHISAPVPPVPGADLREAVRSLPLPEKRAIQACFGVGGPRRRGRRSRELLRLAERAVERLRQTLPQEHFAVNLF